MESENADNEESLKLSPEDSQVFAEALLNPPEPNEALKAAVEKFEENRRGLSFSGRHPELGKMIKCDGCGCRHRSSIIHERKFAETVSVRTPGEPRVKDVPCEPRIAEPRRHRQRANRYGWRTRPNPLILLLIDKARKAGLTK